jgi:hypothetical protein
MTVPVTILPDEAGQYQYSLGSTLERMKNLRLGRDRVISHLEDIPLNPHSRVPIDVIRDVLFGNDTQDATISIVQQRKEDLPQELKGNLAVGDRSRNVGYGRIVRVVLRGDTLDTSWECGGGSRRHGVPPLVGDCAIDEDY